MVKKVYNKTQGYKTYGIVVLMLVYVGVGYALGKEFDTQLLLEALALAGVRNAIK